MGWDGNGQFTRSNGTQSGAATWADAAAAGNNITTAQHDTHDEDLADGIAATLTKNNESKPTADFSPNADASYSFGTALLRWVNIFLSGALKFVAGAFVGSVVMTPTANRTVTIPDATDTLVGKATTDVLTNKTLAAPTFTGAITEALRCAFWQWAGWTPSDVAGTLTPAGSAATNASDAPSYVTQACSSGVLTYTCVKPGLYIAHVQTNTNPVAAVDANSYQQVVVGGTANKIYMSILTTTLPMWISPNNYGGNLVRSFAVLFTAAGQTLTIAPKVAVVRAAGATGNYPTYAEAGIEYVGAP